ISLSTRRTGLRTGCVSFSPDRAASHLRCKTVPRSKFPGANPSPTIIARKGRAAIAGRSSDAESARARGLAPRGEDPSFRPRGVVMKAVLALIVIYVGTFLVAIQGASNAPVEASEPSPVKAKSIDPAKEADIRSLLELVGAQDAIEDAAGFATE